MTKATIDTLVQQKAKKLMQDDPQLDENEAVRLVFRDDPDLYEGYRKSSSIHSNIE